MSVVRATALRTRCKRDSLSSCLITTCVTKVTQVSGAIPSRELMERATKIENTHSFPERWRI
jgi:hypothetical protein